MEDLTPQYEIIPMKEKVILDTAGFGEKIGGLTANSTSLIRGSGSDVFGSDVNGIWLGGSDFSNAPFKVSMAGAMTATSGTFSGTITASSLNIPNTTTTNSFHTDIDGNSWWGCNVADFTADIENATSYILKTGVAKFQQVFSVGNTGKLLEWDNTNLTLLGGIITGGVIQTAVTGARILMDGSQAGNQYFQGFNSDGNQTFYLTTTGQLTLTPRTDISALDIVPIFDTSSVAAAVIRNNANCTGALLRLIQRGSGFSIEGMNSAGDTVLWSIAKTGAIQCEGLDAGTNKITSVVDPTANQDAATKKYVDDNLPDSSDYFSNIVSKTAGEAITIRNAVYVAAGTETDETQAGTTTRNTLKYYNTGYYGQTFTTPAKKTKISKVSLYCSKVNAPTGNVVVSIKATSGEKPTGADLVSKSIAISAIASGSHFEDFVFTTPLALTESTKYAIIVSPPNGDITNCLEIYWTNYADDGDVYTGGDLTVGSGESWTNYVHDLLVKWTLNDIEGYVYKTTNTGSTNRYQNFLGFATATISIGATGNIQYDGVLGGFTSLVEGNYQLAGTSGEITTYSEGKKVALAISTTQLLIKQT